MLRDYKLIIAHKDEITLSFIIEDFSLADRIESSLLDAGYPDVQMYSLVKSYIDERHVHTEDDLAVYDFYQEYINKYSDEDSDSVDPAEHLFR